ncbi:MAG TPA: redoxin domain-containing protein [Bradyrhizobium sp.]|nr:redoxin domain-containing protein [Bradyrhizobium sp.]
MSKKSRKKSSKSASSGMMRAKTAAKAGTEKRDAPKSGPGKSARKASSGSSHKAASKTLKPAKAKPTATGKSATKPAAAKTESRAAASHLLAEGAKAPAFRLPRDGGEVVSLSDFAGKKLVLFFYPRANTPGCTKEAIDFTRLSGAFAESGTAVLGISADSLKAQESFRDKHKLDVPLISDEKHEMLEAYGAWGEKSLYGRTFLGIIRTTVLIGADGLVKRIWRHVKVDGHAESVLQAARLI